MHPAGPGTISLQNGSAAAAQVAAASCPDQAAALEQVRIRQFATLHAAEAFGDLRTALEDAYITNQESAYQDAVVDLSAIASGWPLGNAATQAIVGKAESSLLKDITKAGFKSVNQQLLKDPSMNAALTQLQTSVGDTGPQGVPIDTGVEYLKAITKEGLGEAPGETIFQVVDFVKLGVNLYDSMSQADAMRDMIRRADDQLITLESQRVRPAGRAGQCPASAQSVPGSRRKGRTA